MTLFTVVKNNRDDIVYVYDLAFTISKAITSQHMKSDLCPAFDMTNLCVVRGSQLQKSIKTILDLKQKLRKVWAKVTIAKKEINKLNQLREIILCSWKKSGLKLFSIFPLKKVQNFLIKLGLKMLSRSPLNQPNWQSRLKLRKFSILWKYEDSLTKEVGEAYESNIWDIKQILM